MTNPEPAAVSARRSDSVPRDALALLGIVLLGGVAVALRAVRGSTRERRIGLGLLGFCGAYLVVVAGVLATNAHAATAELSGFAATPGDGAVRLTWAPPPASGVFVVITRRVGTDPAAACATSTGTTEVHRGSAADGAYVDANAASGSSWHYRACTYTGSPASASAGVVASATPQGGLDQSPPNAPTKVALSIDSTRVLLTWKLPGATDLDHVVVVRRIGARPRSLTDGVVVPTTDLATSAVDQPSSTKSIYYAVFAVDAAGNVSPAGKAPTLKRFQPALITPLTGARISGRATFRWRAVHGATYYNVQIWTKRFGVRGARKVLSVQVLRGTSLRLRKPLAHGRYTWYVFSFLPRAHPNFPLLGSAPFTA